MGPILRFFLMVLVLWASCAYGQYNWHQTPRQQSHSHYPQQTYYNYPRQHYKYPTYHKSPCSAQTPCYEQLLTYTSDAVPVLSPQIPQDFIYHYRRAGFNRYDIIEEGKRAAQFFHHQYGVDVGDLPDEAYLAPNITLPGGVRFSYKTFLPSVSKAVINMASQGPVVQFINAPVSTAEWILDFTADYYSNGAYKGHIPAGSGSGFGSYIFDTCPNESAYNPCRSTLSRKPKGQVFIRFKTRTFKRPGMIDCNLEHDEWGEGHVIGAGVTTEADGVLHWRLLYTFPKSCDSSMKCFARRLY